MAIIAKENLLGAWAFLIGIVLAIAVGLLGAVFEKDFVFAVLAVIGLVVGFGFINVASKDVNTFLMASVSLVIVSFAGAEVISGIQFLELGNVISSTLGALLVMLVPATIVVAIKSLFSVAQK